MYLIIRINHNFFVVFVYDRFILTKTDWEFWNQHSLTSNIFRLMQEELNNEINSLAFELIPKRLFSSVDQEIIRIRRENNEKAAEVIRQLALKNLVRQQENRADGQNIVEGMLGVAGNKQKASNNKRIQGANNKSTCGQSCSVKECQDIAINISNCSKEEVCFTRFFCNLHGPDHSQHFGQFLDDVQITSSAVTSVVTLKANSNLKGQQSNYKGKTKANLAKELDDKNAEIKELLNRFNTTCSGSGSITTNSAALTSTLTICTGTSNLNVNAIAKKKRKLDSNLNINEINKNKELEINIDVDSSQEIPNILSSLSDISESTSKRPCINSSNVDITLTEHAHAQDSSNNNITINRVSNDQLQISLSRSVDTDLDDSCTYDWNNELEHQTAADAVNEAVATLEVEPNTNTNNLSNIISEAENSNRKETLKINCNSTDLDINNFKSNIKLTTACTISGNLKKMINVVDKAINGVQKDYCSIYVQICNRLDWSCYKDEYLSLFKYYNLAPTNDVVLLIESLQKRNSSNTRESIVTSFIQMIVEKLKK